MDENRFWQIIEESRQGLSSDDIDGNMDLQAANLKEILSTLPRADLESFAELFSTFANKAYRWDLWGAAYVIGGGCSDDSFMDFRSWLISMGREAYETGINAPDDLVRFAEDDTVEDCFFEEFAYVADEVYEEKFGKEMTSHVAHPDDPAGEEWQEEDLAAMFPQLSRAFDE